MTQIGNPTDSGMEAQVSATQIDSARLTLLQVARQLTTSPDDISSLRAIVDAAARISQADCVQLTLFGTFTARPLTAGPLEYPLSDLQPFLSSLSTTAGHLRSADIQTAASSAHLPVSSLPSSVWFWALEGPTHRQGLLLVAFAQPKELSEDQQDSLEILASYAALITSRMASNAGGKPALPLEALLDSMTEPILIVDQAGCISLLNHAAEQLLNTRSQDALAHPADDILTEHPKLQRYLHSTTNLQEDEEWTSPNGRIFSPRLSRIASDQGHSGTSVLILRDITHFKELNKRQAEFVRLVSHDLRSPLTYMKGFASLLSMTGELNERQVGFVDKILGGITQMSALVENIQAAGRWDPETGFYEMSREPTDLLMLANEIVSNHQELARKQSIEISAQIAPNVPIVNVDSLMIERALINLVENAIKYSPNGGEVRLSIDVKDEALQFCVADHGLGIEAQHIPQLFQRGYRVITPAVKEHKIKGSGLGLFIVRSVARRHGGDVWVESENGKGSRFYFSIPLTGANLVGGGDGE